MTDSLIMSTWTSSNLKYAKVANGTKNVKVAHQSIHLIV